MDPLRALKLEGSPKGAAESEKARSAFFKILTLYFLSVTKKDLPGFCAIKNFNNGCESRKSPKFLDHSKNHDLIINGMSLAHASERVVSGKWGETVLIKVFSLRFDTLLGGFDDRPIHEFSQDKEVLQVTDHLLTRNDIPYLVFILKYYPFRKETEGVGPTAGEMRGKEPWRKELGEENLPLFNRLRDWRSERAKKDGVPPYVIFTNVQLVAVAKIKPQSIAVLAQIEGVGRGKTERYGSEVMAILQPNSDVFAAPKVAEDPSNG